MVSKRSPSRSRPRSSSKTLPTRASTATPLRAAFCADARDRVLGDVEGDRLVAAASQHQREAAVVAEAVEHPAARVGRRGGAVLALIEEQPGLLAVPQIDVVLDAGLGDVDRCRAPRRPARRRAARALRARAPADRCAPGCRAAAADRSAPRRPPAAAGPCPATAPAPRGSRRSDRRSATAAGRLRRGPAGRRCASIASDSRNAIAASIRRAHQRLVGAAARRRSASAA